MCPIQPPGGTPRPICPNHLPGGTPLPICPNCRVKVFHQVFSNLLHPSSWQKYALIIHVATMCPLHVFIVLPCNNYTCESSNMTFKLYQNLLNNGPWGPSDPLHSPQQPRPLHGHCAVWWCRPLSHSTNLMGLKSALREGFTKQKTPLELILNSPNDIALSMYFTSFCPPMTSEHGLTQYKIWFINLTLFLEHPGIVKDSYLKLDV